MLLVFIEENGLLIAWRDYGEPFPMTDNGRIEILKDFSLSIKNVTPSDAGRYICEVSDFRGYFIGNKTDLKVAGKLVICRTEGGKFCSYGPKYI